MRERGHATRSYGHPQPPKPNPSVSVLDVSVHRSRRRCVPVSICQVVKGGALAAGDNDRGSFSVLIVETLILALLGERSTAIGMEDS